MRCAYVRNAREIEKQNMKLKIAAELQPGLCEKYNYFIHVQEAAANVHYRAQHPEMLNKVVPGPSRGGRGVLKM